MRCEVRGEERRGDEIDNNLPRVPHRSLPNILYVRVWPYDILLLLLCYSVRSEENCDSGDLWGDASVM